MKANDRRSSSRALVHTTESFSGHASLAVSPHPTQTSGMADDRDIRPEAHRLVEGLPQGAGWDDLMYAIYVRQALEAGLADADAGRTVDHESAMSRIRARIRRAS